MKRNILIGITLLLFSLPALGYAQTGGNYALSGSATGVDDYMSIGGNYTLQGSIGQPISGSISGGSYTVVGGFWVIDKFTEGTIGADQRVYIPIVINGD